MTYKVKFVVKKGGKIETTVEGIKGPSCLEKTAWLDNLGRVVEHSDTPEAFELEEELEEGVDETVSAGDDYGW
jgi:hypothetical protein